MQYNEWSGEGEDDEPVPGGVSVPAAAPGQSGGEPRVPRPAPVPAPGPVPAQLWPHLLQHTHSSACIKPGGTQYHATK